MPGAAVELHFFARVRKRRGGLLRPGWTDRLAAQMAAKTGTALLELAADLPSFEATFEHRTARHAANGELDALRIALAFPDLDAVQRQVGGALRGNVDRATPSIAVARQIHLDVQRRTGDVDTALPMAIKVGKCGRCDANGRYRARLGQHRETLGQLGQHSTTPRQRLLATIRRGRRFIPSAPRAAAFARLPGAGLLG